MSQYILVLYRVYTDSNRAISHEQFILPMRAHIIYKFTIAIKHLVKLLLLLTVLGNGGQIPH